MGIHAYFRGFNEVEKIVRCPGKFKFEEHNVAAHSWKVTQYVQFFATVEEKNGVSINWKRLFDITTGHDYAERFTGDIKTPVKYATPELRAMIQHVEEAMTQKFIEEEIPEEFKEIFKVRLSEGKDNSTEGKLLALADKLDQVYEAFSELQKGNPEREYVSMYVNALTAIKNIKLTSVQYFLDYILPDMIAEEMLTKVDIRKVTEEALAM